MAEQSEDRIEQASAVLIAFSKWINEGMEGKDPEAITLHRVFKLAEENGEVASALIGALGANRRKGRNKTLDEAKDELLDVMVTAVGAYEHLDGHSGQSIDRFLEKIHSVAARAGIPGAEQSFEG